MSTKDTGECKGSSGFQWPVPLATPLSMGGKSIPSMVSKSVQSAKGPTNPFSVTPPGNEPLDMWGLPPLQQAEKPARFFFYHKNCNDGLMSAVMAFLKYGNHYSDAPNNGYEGSDSSSKCRYIPIYPDEDIDEVVLASMAPSSRVYFLDVLASNNSLKRINSHVRLIDHHTVNIHRFEFLSRKFTNLENCSSGNPQESAAIQCYSRFCGSLTLAPHVWKWARLVSARDTMTFDNAREETKARFAYIYLNTMDKTIAQWVSVVLQKPFDKLFEKGEAALAFYEHQLKDAMKDTFKFKYAEHPITLVNCSQIFFSDAAWVAPKGLYMNATFRKGGVQIQLRGEGAQFIARQMGGDGHPRAAGAFTTKDRFMEVVYG